MDYTKQEIDIAIVNAFKAIDYEKEYQKALRDLAEVMFDLDEDNNEVEPLNTND